MIKIERLKNDEVLQSGDMITWVTSHYSRPCWAEVVHDNGNELIVKDYDANGLQEDENRKCKKSRMWIWKLIEKNETTN